MIINYFIGECCRHIICLFTCRAEILRNPLHKNHIGKVRICFKIGVPFFFCGFFYLVTLFIAAFRYHMAVSVLEDCSTGSSDHIVRYNPIVFFICFSEDCSRTSIHRLNFHAVLHMPTIISIIKRIVCKRCQHIGNTQYMKRSIFKSVIIHYDTGRRQFCIPQILRITEAELRNCPHIR